MREAEKRTKVETATKQKGTSSKQSYENQKKLKSLTNKISKIEAAIGKLEKEIKEIDVELSINYDETIAKPNFFDNYQAKKQEFTDLMEAWEVATTEMEAFQ